MKTLNYDASVPIAANATFSVKVDPNKAPGDQQFKDYIPGTPTKSSVVVRKDAYRKPLVRYSDDYISGADMAVKAHNDKNHILRIAKEMYAEQAKRREDYLAAKALIDKATKAQIEHPSVELGRALKIAARNKPLSKEEAIEKATEQFYAKG